MGAAEETNRRDRQTGGTDRQTGERHRQEGQIASAAAAVRLCLGSDGKEGREAGMQFALPPAALTAPRG